MGCDGVVLSTIHQDNHPSVVIKHVQFGFGRPVVFNELTKTNQKKEKHSFFIALDYQKKGLEIENEHKHHSIKNSFL